MSHMGLKVLLSTIVSNRERRSRRMKKQSAAYQRRLAALVVAVFAFAGLGLLGYSLVAGEQAARTHRPCAGSGGRRARLRRLRERVREGSPRRCRPREGYGFPVAEDCQRLHRGPQGWLYRDEEQPRVLGPRQAGEGG